MKTTIEQLQTLHDRMIEAMRKQQKQAQSLELAIVRSNGQIPKAFTQGDK